MFHRKEIISEVLSFDQFSNYASIETIPKPPKKVLFHTSMYEFCNCDNDVQKQLFHNLFSYSEIHFHSLPLRQNSNYIS